MRRFKDLGSTTDGRTCFQLNLNNTIEKKIICSFNKNFIIQWTPIVITPFPQTTNTQTSLISEVMNRD